VRVAARSLHTRAAADACAGNAGGTVSEPTATTPKQLLHLVFGGELTKLDGTEFRDLSKLDVVGIYPNYATALVAWKAKAQQTVDNAQIRYFIVHLHRLLEP
jgi:hypothetical protein